MLIITKVMIQDLENQLRNYEQVVSFLAFRDHKEIIKQYKHNFEHWDRMVHFLKMGNRAEALLEYQHLSDDEAKNRISSDLICALNYPNTIFEIA